MAILFISHRSQDSMLARRLAGELVAHGHDVRLDDWDLHIGDDIVRWIDRSLADARYLVLCYSDAGVDSPWTGRGWMSTLARQLNGESVTILPVRLTGDDVPAILAAIKYADLVNDWDRGVKDLLAAIQ